jgi:hypothetical protein
MIRYLLRLFKRPRPLHERYAEFQKIYRGRTLA